MWHNMSFLNNQWLGSKWLAKLNRVSRNTHTCVVAAEAVLACGLPEPSNTTLKSVGNGSNDVLVRVEWTIGDRFTIGLTSRYNWNDKMWYTVDTLGHAGGETFEMFQEVFDHETPPSDIARVVGEELKR
jgi:hypothetical protein